MAKFNRTPKEIFKSVEEVDSEAVKSDPIYKEKIPVSEELQVREKEIEKEKTDEPVLISEDIIAEVAPLEISRNLLIDHPITKEDDKSVIETQTIEESISIHQKLVTLPVEGWKIIGEQIQDIPPLNGMPVKISKDGKDEGTVAFWKRTRAFNGKRWAETGKWLDFMTGVSIAFDPKYWRERY